MIDLTTDFLRSRLFEALVPEEVPGPPVVVVRSLVDQNGARMAGGELGLSLTIVGIDQDTLSRGPYFERVTKKDEQGRTTDTALKPVLNFNLHMLVTADVGRADAVPDKAAEDYSRALRRIGSVIKFFHQRPLFCSDNHDTMPEGIARLTVHLANLSMQDQHSLWGYLGAKYLPSVLYKVSLMTDQAALNPHLFKPDQISLGLLSADSPLIEPGKKFASTHLLKVTTESSH